MTLEADMALLQRMREEFESRNTTEERRTEIVIKVREMAEAIPHYELRCMNCKHAVVDIPYTHALAAGMIYSRAGKREYRISQCCEFCFDKITEELEDE